MKHTKGYITDDGNFFEHAVDAAYHEAETVMLSELSQRELDATQLLPLFEEIGDIIRSYVDAYDARAAFHKGDDGRATESTATIQSFTTRSDGAMSDVGSGERTEAVPESGEGNGAGSRGHDASGVRGGEDLAVGAHSETAEARTGYGEPHIREGALDELDAVDEAIRQGPAGRSA